MRGRDDTMDKNIYFFLVFMIIITVGVGFLVTGCTGKVSGNILVKTDHLPRIDGIIDIDEYNVVMETEKMTLYLCRNNENLFFGLSGKTMGWSSLGFGTMGMDKSHIIMGYGNNDSHVLEEHTGKGHSHTPAQKKIILDSMIIDSNGTTTFEGSVKADDIISPDQTTLSLIIACGEADDFISRHIFRKILIVKLARD